MNTDKVIEALSSEGFVVDEIKEIANAQQIIFTNGSKVNVFHKKKSTTLVQPTLRSL